MLLPAHPVRALFTLTRTPFSTTPTPTPTPPPTTTTTAAAAAAATKTWWLLGGHLANTLTLTRMAATPLLGFWIWTGSFGVASAGFVLAGLSDWADGYIAKRFHQQSILGSYLDPLADKMLITVTTVALAGNGVIPVPLAALIVARDVALVAATLALRIRMIPKPVTWSRIFQVSDVQAFEIKPSNTSKANTVSQLLLLGSGVLHGACGFPPMPVIDSLGYLVAGTTVASGLGYLFSRSAIKKLGNTQKSPPPPH